MSDWISFDRWPECAELERPGYRFEIKNAEGEAFSQNARFHGFVARIGDLAAEAGWHRRTAPS